MVHCHFEPFDSAQDKLKSRSYWIQRLKNEVSTALDLTFFVYELVLSFHNSLQIPLLRPYFVFFSVRSSAMHLEKAFIWTQNLGFSHESENSRRVLYD
ncbi:hypothetical protein Murru_3391 [Allomuricauda ruestringensis DSM 13258]|uniref:Uncharacterized protein n=1 Tax=Allomuricauda ruestringensis (strain DSM 13258 / CIP 107369 / LMG 19739 / B1) TaxID=886377 RepID=G2PNJ2_ALLRU|nr:hypothetical protein Murru_3391 [Allomuricauda ruestringensis DSM 13258]